MLTPAQCNPPMIRACSIFTHRFITTSRPPRERDPRGFFAAYADLHPQHLRAFRHGGARDRRHVLGAAKAIDDVDGTGNRREIRIALLAEHFGVRRVDRDHAIPAVLQVLRGEIARTIPTRRESDDGDDARAREDPAQARNVVGDLQSSPAIAAGSGSGRTGRAGGCRSGRSWRPRRVDCCGFASLAAASLAHGRRTPRLATIYDVVLPCGTPIRAATGSPPDRGAWSSPATIRSGRPPVFPRL